MNLTRTLEKKVLILLMAVPFYFLVIGQAAENNPFQLPVPKSNFKVWVSVSCDDENTKAFIESHVKRELRSLQDVDLVKAGDGIYELIIAAAEPTYEATGRKTGDIGLAWISLKRFDNKPLTSKYTSTLDRAGIQNMTEWLYHSPSLRLLMDDKTDLDDLCKNIVVAFDVKMLEPDRKAR